MHFCLYVLLESPFDVEREVERRLAPFDENLKVEEHDAECYCDYDLSHSVAMRRAEAETGLTVEALRESHDAIPAYRRPAWRDHIAPLWDAKDRYYKELGPNVQFDSDCDTCKGTGVRRTTSNPQGHWDWYSIGGRWMGRFAEGYDVEKDPKNLEPCIPCGATGVRTDETARAWTVAEKLSELAASGAFVPADQSRLDALLTRRDDFLRIGNRLDIPQVVANLGLFTCDARRLVEKALNDSYLGRKCNGCDGTGKAVKFSSELRKVGFMEQVASLQLDDDQIPFAILTPDGVWHDKDQQKEEAYEERDAAWKVRGRALLIEHRDSVAVIVDCHT
jgi:hypothetical protein